MSKYDTPENMCTALTTFIMEMRMQVAAIRAYNNVFKDKLCDNIFLKRAYDSIWQELLSEIARIFDKAYTGSNENCTLLRLKELCLKEQYSNVFLGGESNELIKSLDSVIEFYSQLPVEKSRNKQLAHHDLKQVIAGNCIEISLAQIELLILNTTDVFSKIYTQFNLGWFEFSFSNYEKLVEQYENDILSVTNLTYSKTHSNIY